MSLYGKVQGTTVLEYKDFASMNDQSALAPGKPKWLPVVEQNATYDPVTTTRTGPTVIVQAAQIVWQYTLTAKTAAENDQARQSKINAVHDQATIRLTPKAGASASQQILALTKLMQLLYKYTDRTAWTQADKDAVQAAVQRLQLSDQVRQAEDTKVGELQALTDPTAINNYDPATGWPA